MSLFECFNELISDEEITCMASFDEEDKPVSQIDSRASSVKCATKSVASALTLDGDPDFIILHEASGPAQRVSDITRSIKHTKVTSQTSGKVISTKSGQECLERTNLPKKGVKHRTANASRLANYLLQHVDSTPTGSVHKHKDQVSHQTVYVDRDTCKESGGECEPGNSMEWFGLNSEEDLDEFEHFDDGAD